MKIQLCAPIKIKQNRRFVKTKLCRPVTSTSSCTSSYLTETGEILNTESGECLIIN